MDCWRARQGLWPPERPRIAGDEVVAAQRHVEGCRECTDYFMQDRALLDLYERVRTQPAPLEVRERVFDALSKARWGRDVKANTLQTRFGWMRMNAWPVALTAVMLLVLTIEMRPRVAPTPLDDPAMFVEDYLRRAVGQDHIETNDPGEISRFLQRELGMPLHPLAFAGLAVERVEICLLEGRRGAMIVYKKDGAEVSHYLFPRDGADERSPTISGNSNNDSGTDMPVVTWSTPRVEQALVGELTSEQLLEMARRGSSQE